VEEVITEKVATVLGMDEEELHSEATNVCMKCSNHEDLNKLVCSLNENVKVYLRREKVQLLTLAQKAGPSIELPQNLEQTITWPSKPENCKGILFELDGKVRKPFSPHLKEKVVDFFKMMNIIRSLGQITNLVRVRLRPFCYI